MKISKADGVALLVALGFTKAGEWEDEKLLERLGQVPSKVKPEDVPPDHLTTYERLTDAAEHNNELIFSDSTGSAKPEKEAPVNIADMDMAGLRALVEEKKLKVPKSALKNVEVLRVEVKKALKAGGKQSSVDRAVDKAAKGKKSGKRAAATKDEDDEEPKSKKDKSERQVDKFGSAVGSIRSKVNMALTNDWQSDEDIAKAAGVSLRQARSRLRRAARKGMLEVSRHIDYRLPKGSKN